MPLKLSSVPSPLPANASKPAAPLLHQLAGMAAARAWGEALVADLDAFTSGRIAWSEVDPGVLLSGPPGTGKTTYATALAATCGIHLIATSYAQWQRSEGGHLGDVLAAMEADFALARLLAPCILFIDEFDTFPTRRSRRKNDDWWTSVVNALLEALDGVAGREGVIVIAACNDASGIDPALLRAGRFDRRIQIAMPSIADLEEILRFHLKEDTGRIEDLGAVAILAAGMSGAEVERLVRDGRRIARRKGHKVSQAALVAALEAGHPARSREVAQRIAVHEAGHALIAIHLDPRTEVAVSIVNRGATGGTTALQGPVAGAVTRAALDAQLVTLLAGRAAEEALLGAPSTGAGGSEQSDLAQATRLATDIVASYGLSDHGSLVWLGTLSGEAQLLLEPRISRQVSHILDTAYQRALTLVRTQEREILAVAKALVERRALSNEALLEVVAETRRAWEAPAA